MFLGRFYVRIVYFNALYTRFHYKIVYLRLRFIILMHNTFKLIFCAPKRFCVPVISAQLYSLHLGFLIKSCKAIMMWIKLFRTPFPNPLLWYVFALDPQALFLVYTQAKISIKKYFIRLEIELNLNRKSVLPADDFFELKPQLSRN